MAKHTLKMLRCRKIFKVCLVIFYVEILVWVARLKNFSEV